MSLVAHLALRPTCLFVHHHPLQLQPSSLCPLRYVQTGRLWPGSDVSRVVQRDPSSADGGAQDARDDAQFDGNKVAQALAVAKRAEAQAQAVARMVAASRSASDKRMAGRTACVRVAAASPYAFHHSARDFNGRPTG